MNLKIKGECTVDLKEGETLREASYRQIMEAISEINNKYPEATVALGSWQFTDEVSLSAWREGNLK